MIGAMLFGSSMRINTFPQFFYYETSWGMLLSFFSTVASIKAALYPAWQKPAVILLEVSNVFNIVITPLFWALLAKTIFPLVPLTPAGIVFDLHMATEHILPLLITGSNIVLTDMYLLKSDWKAATIAGIIYMFANALGTYMQGAGLYPVADWTNIPLTVFLYSLQAVILGAIQYGVAAYSQKVYKPSVNQI